MRTALLALAFALPFTAHADIQVDLADPASHLKLIMDEEFAHRDDGSWRFRVGFWFAHYPQTGYWPETDVSVAAQPTLIESPPGLHGEADFVYINGPEVPAWAKPASFVTFPEFASSPAELQPKWRLTGHITVDDFFGTIVLAQTGTLSYYDVATNSGWTLPFSNAESFLPLTGEPIVGGGGIFAVIDGPTVPRPVVPEPMTWAALLFGVVLLGTKKWRLISD